GPTHRLRRSPRPSRGQVRLNGTTGAASGGSRRSAWFQAGSPARCPYNGSGGHPGTTWDRGMAGHGDQLSRKQEQAIAALLTEPTVEQAAVKAGVKYPTLKSWLARPAFRDAYAAARRQILDRTVARLLALTGKALDTLEENLACASPAA